MSTYTNTSAVYNGNLAAIRLAQPQLEAQIRAISEGITSSALTELHAELCNTYDIETADNLEFAWGRIDKGLLEWESLFSDATFGEFSAVRSKIEDLRKISEDEVEIMAAYSDLLCAVESAMKEMAGYEQQVAAEAVDLALHDLGYVVNRAHQPGITGFEASRGNSKLLVQVADGGQVATDHIGLSDGDSCGSAQEAFIERIGRYGVVLTEEDRHNHRDPRGGGLAQRAARAKGANLAERIAASYVSGPRAVGAQPGRATIRTEIV